MDRNIKNKGRQKNVTSGGGNANRRGKAKTSGPVGNKTGYASRKRPSSSSSSSGGSSGGLGNLFGSSSSSSGSSRPTGKLNIGKIILIIVLIIVAFFILRSCLSSGDGGGLFAGTDSLLAQNNSTTDNLQSDTPSAGVSTTNSANVNTSVSNLARNKRTQIVGNGQDTFTIMIFMLGTDLESRGGMATRDLQEILAADIADNVNIIIETGGTKKWQNNIISNKTNQRYKVEKSGKSDGKNGLKLLQDNLGRRAMTDPATLVDFVNYSKQNFPANRYALIFWDHGGGSTAGYGHDEYAPNTTMTLDKIHGALTKTNVDFDFVGFDACLMATFETAVMLENHADYLIASEENEPGIGWYYTNWLSAISNNTSISTTDIGKILIDDFIEKCYDNSARDKTTLSIVDLAEFSGTVPEAFRAFAVSTGDLIEAEQYKSVSNARTGSREFGQPQRLDQVDLIHLAENLNTPEALALVAVLKDTIKYNRTSNTIANANGLSIYFPFGSLNKLGPMLDTYEEIGMDAEYSDAIKSFANLETGGQALSTGSGSPLGSLLGGLTGGSSGGGSLVGGLIGSLIQGADFSNILGGGNDATPQENGANWLNTDEIEQNEQYYQDNRLDNDRLVYTQKDGGNVVKLTDKEWDMVQTIELNVFLDDGYGYIDLGLDNVFTFDSDGDLVADYDGTWLALNGQNVAYYLISEEWQGNNYAIVGRVPAELNGEQVELILAFTNAVPNGEVLGARTVYDDDTVAKGLTKITNGDELDFLCDFYSYDETYNDAYYLGETMVVYDGLAVSNVPIGDATAKVTFRLTDVYNNTYWTPALNY